MAAPRGAGAGAHYEEMAKAVQALDTLRSTGIIQADEYRASYNSKSSR